MQTLIVAIIVAASIGWFGHKLYKTATTEDTGCGGGCDCGKDPLSDYRNEKDSH